MLYLVGLGLGDEKDITVRGLEVVKSCSKVFLEAYTSVLGVGKERLEAFYEREIILADRELVESGADVAIVDAARDEDIAFLVVGDPYGATTHTDLALRAKEKGIPVEVIHNASIMNAVGCCGLQLYKFGETVSIVFFTDEWQPDSFYDKIKANAVTGLHTLCLLDIKMKEQSVENLCRGRNVFEPPRFLTVNGAIDQLLLIEETRKEGVLSEDTMVVGLARVGQPTQLVVYGPMKDVRLVDFGGPLHSMIVVGECHFLEEDIVKTFSIEAQGIELCDEVPAASYVGDPTGSSVETNTPAEPAA